MVSQTNLDVADDDVHDFDIDTPPRSTALQAENSYSSQHGLRHYHTHIEALLHGSHRMQWMSAAKGIVCGIIAGALVVIYRAAIARGNTWAVSLYQYLGRHPLMITVWAVAALLVAWAISKMIAWEPMASGSGIPQVEGVLLWGLKMRWWSILIVRFIAGVVCGFFGMSLGREGPSIQIGAAGAHSVAGRLSKNKLEHDNYIAAGAAAGLSAAFSAPLSGMMFALEEVYRSFNPTVLFTATSAALTADLVSKIFLGFTPVLQFSDIVQLDLRAYLWLVPLGIFSGFIGAAMNKMLLGMQTLYSHIPSMWRIALALVFALPIGLTTPLALGGGAHLIQYAEQATAAVSVITLVWLLIAKMIFTSTSFGSGVPGGIFLPILTVGAVAGSLFAKSVSLLNLGEWGLDGKYIATFTVLAMTGALTASVKAPITSMLLVVEMTGSLVHMFPVALVTFLALMTSDALRIEPIYHVLLERYMDGPGKKDLAPADNTPDTTSSGIMSVPAELGSSVVGKSIQEIDWPEHTVVVAIRRAGKEFVPRSSTIIHPADELVVVFRGTNQKNAREDVTTLTRSAY